MADETAKPATDDSERKVEGERPDQIADRWFRELSAADTHEDKWRKRAQDILDLYLNEQERADDSSSQRFNILFANTEVLKGALYSQAPAPDIRRRHLDRDPVGRVAAIVLQRALVAALAQEHDGEDFDFVMRSGVFDMVLPGRAVARVKYKPTITKSQKRVEAEAPPEGEEPPQGLLSDKKGWYRQEEQEEVSYECTESSHVEWPMFRCSPAKRWAKVRWVAFGELLTRDDCVREFGDKIGNEIELKWAPKGQDTDGAENKIFKRALVWVIWNKTKREVVMVSEGYKDGPLKVVPDPLRLEQFFPCPRPLYSIFTTTSLIPIPEYKMYEDHALQLDRLEERIAVLTDACKRRGVYDKAIEELALLADAGDNEFIPVKNYREFLQKGGVAELFAELSIENIAKVLKELMVQADAKKAQIYEIIGISDIMRGATKAQETLGAQKIKDQWGSVRVGPRQQEVQRYARDMIRIHAEIMAEHFSPQTLADMSGIDLFFTVAEKQQAKALMQQQEGASADPRIYRPTWEEVMKLLRNDRLRGFSIGIETDSTIKHRADDEQKNRVELVTAVTGYLEKVLPAVAQGLMPKKFAGELLAFAVRAFPTGPQIEEILDELTGANVDVEKPQQPSAEVIRLQQQVQELGGAADEAKLKREEMALKRFEIKGRVAEATGESPEMLAALAQLGQSLGQLAGPRYSEIVRDPLTQKALGAVTQPMPAAEAPAAAAGESRQARGEAQASKEETIVRLPEILATLASAIEQMNAPRERELIRDPFTGKPVGAIDKPMPVAPEAQQRALPAGVSPEPPPEPPQEPTALDRLPDMLAPLQQLPDALAPLAALPEVMSRLAQALAGLAQPRYRELVLDPQTQKPVGAIDKPMPPQTTH